MFDDAVLRSRVIASIGAIAPPPVPLAQIQRRIASDDAPAPRAGTKRWRPALVAAAAAVAICAAVPLVAPGVVQSVEERVAEILQWTPPPVPPPASLMAQLRSSPVTLEAARARVPFALVAPAGLPADVASSSIRIAPTAVYVKATRTWRLGSPALHFDYRRSGGRTFSLTVDRFDPQTGPEGRFMYEDTGKVRDGMPVLIRYERFAWRNGDQVTTAIADGIDAGEIARIRRAMNGVALRPSESRRESDAAPIVRMYGAP